MNNPSPIEEFCRRESLDPHARAEIVAFIAQGYEAGREEAKKHFIDLGFEELDKAEKKGRTQGRKEERERLREVAREYKRKGFELETFIYSGFIITPTKEVCGWCKPPLGCATKTCTCACHSTKAGGIVEPI